MKMQEIQHVFQWQCGIPQFLDTVKMHVHCLCIWMLIDRTPKNCRAHKNSRLILLQRKKSNLNNQQTSAKWIYTREHLCIESFQNELNPVSKQTAEFISAGQLTPNKNSIIWMQNIHLKIASTNLLYLIPLQTNIKNLTYPWQLVLWKLEFNITF